jgi:hypothetical protein
MRSSLIEGIVSIINLLPMTLAFTLPPSTIFARFLISAVVNISPFLPTLSVVSDSVLISESFGSSDYLKMSEAETLKRQKATLSTGRSILQQSK